MVPSPTLSALEYLLYLGDYFSLEHRHSLIIIGDFLVDHGLIFK